MVTRKKKDVLTYPKDPEQTVRVPAVKNPKVPTRGTR